MFRRGLTLCCLGALASTMAQCPGDFTLVQDEYCYFKSTSQATWDDANAACEEMNGWLVVLKSTHQNYGLLNWLVEENGMSFSNFFSGPYIGIRRFNTSSEDFTWSHEPDQDSTYTNWKTEIPYITGGSDNCGVMTADSTWFNFKCTDKRDYICQVNYGSSSPTLSPSFHTPHPTHRPTHYHSHTSHPTPAPGTVISIAPTGAAALTNEVSSEEGSSYDVDVSVHMSYIFIVVGILFTIAVLYRRRQQWPFPFGQKSKNVRLNDADGTNSTHNLVEMETRKTYGEDIEQQASEEIDMGGCFAFSNSSAEEMLASQLNVKVYSSVSNDLNAS